MRRMASTPSAAAAPVAPVFAAHVNPAVPWRELFELGSAAGAEPTGQNGQQGGQEAVGLPQRVYYADPVGTGYNEVQRIGPGAMLSIAHCVITDDQTHTVKTGGDLFLLRASLNNGLVYSSPHTGALEFRTPGIMVSHIPQGVPLTVTVSGGQRQASALLLLRARAFEEVFGLRDVDLPGPVRDALQGRNPAGTLAALPITSAVAAVVQSLLRGLQNHGKAMELVSLVMQLIDESPAFAGARPVRKRDIDLAHEARDMLDRDLARPPTISELARHVGLNQNKLKALFPTLFGTTVHAYSVQSRMLQAQTLLLDGQLSIAQVAERVGYEHQSSFATAFRNYTGMAAKDYRKQRAALVVPLRPQPTRPRH
jgi:AraC-like DNA-binding protein